MVVLIGNGSIGKRYAAILRNLGVEFDIYDSTAHTERVSEWTKYDKAIVATPTETHTQICMELIFAKVPFLCEKPFTKDIRKAAILREAAETLGVPGFVVNNYGFVTRGRWPQDLTYDFYNTGKDGIVWDVCQLVYLAKLYRANLIVEKHSFTWDFYIDKEKIEYARIERSYEEMISMFLSGHTQGLWNLKAAVEMEAICQELHKEHHGKDSFRYTGSEQIYSVAG